MSALNEGGIHGDAIDTGKISMYAVTDPATNAATTSTIIGVYGGAIITTTTTGNSQTLASPTDTTAGKIFVIVNNDTSTNTIPVVANSVTYTIGIGVGQAFIWDGTKWMPTDLGITAIPVTVIQGGTGLSTITDHSVMVGSGTGAVTPIPVGATGEILCGSTGADPAFSATPSGLTSLGVTTLNADHIAEKTGSHGVVFDNIASSAYEIYDTHYDTIFIPASAMTPTATNGAVGSTAEYATNDINMDYLLFDGATEQFAEFQFPMPENWDRGTIKAKFYWSSDSGSTANDTVEWKVACGALSDSDAIDAALGTAQVISDALLADNGTDLQVSGATPAITVGGTPALGDLVHFKVSRNVGGTDDMTENARLFGVWLQYKANTSVASW